MRQRPCVVAITRQLISRRVPEHSGCTRKRQLRGPPSSLHHPQEPRQLRRPSAALFVNCLIVAAGGFLVTRLRGAQRGIFVFRRFATPTPKSCLPSIAQGGLRNSAKNTSEIGAFWARKALCKFWKKLKLCARLIQKDEGTKPNLPMYTHCPRSILFPELRTRRSLMTPLVDPAISSHKMNALGEN